MENSHKDNILSIIELAVIDSISNDLEEIKEIYNLINHPQHYGWLKENINNLERNNNFYALEFNVSTMTINNWLFALEKHKLIKIHYYKKERKVYLLN